MSLDLTTLHAQVVGAEATIRSVRLALERAIADRIREQEPEPKKVPPTFGDSESHQPQES